MFMGVSYASLNAVAHYAQCVLTGIGSGDGKHVRRASRQLCGSATESAPQLCAAQLLD